MIVSARTATIFVALQFGVQIGKDLMVERVEKQMRADGLLQPGDVLISVNDIRIEDVDHFYKVSLF